MDGQSFAMFIAVSTIAIFALVVWIVHIVADEILRGE